MKPSKLIIMVKFYKHYTVYPLCSREMSQYWVRDGLEYGCSLCENMTDEELNLVAEELTKEWAQKKQNKK